jgi:short/branched chain acyl-CoA dehydrogenase
MITMDHRLTPEHEELRRAVEKFAHDVVAPTIGDLYERHEFPYEIVREMGRMGLFGLPFPEEYGGMGGDHLALGIALEEPARVDSSVAIILEAGVSLGAMPVYLFGTEEQKRRWLLRLYAGAHGPDRLARRGVAAGAGGAVQEGGGDGEAVLLHGRRGQRA